MIEVKSIQIKKYTANITFMGSEDGEDGDDEVQWDLQSGMIQAESQAPEYSMTVTGSGEGDFPN